MTRLPSRTRTNSRDAPADGCACSTGAPAERSRQLRARATAAGRTVMSIGIEGNHRSQMEHTSRIWPWPRISSSQLTRYRLPPYFWLGSSASGRGARAARRACGVHHVGNGSELSYEASAVDHHAARRSHRRAGPEVRAAREDPADGMEQLESIP